MKNKNKILLAIIVVAVIIAIDIWLFGNKKINDAIVVPEVAVSTSTRVVAARPAASPTVVDPLGKNTWKTYSDDQITFKYPADWVVKKTIFTRGGYSIEVRSPSRTNFPGYEGKAVNYLTIISNANVLSGFATVEREVRQNGVFNVEGDYTATKEHAISLEVIKTIVRK